MIEQPRNNVSATRNGTENVSERQLSSRMLAMTDRKADMRCLAPPIATAMQRALTTAGRTVMVELATATTGIVWTSSSKIG